MQPSDHEIQNPVIDHRYQESLILIYLDPVSEDS